MKKFEIPFASKCLFAHEHFNNNNENILLCFADEESTISAYKQLAFFDSKKNKKSNVLYFPALDTVPYDRVSPSTDILSKRANVLTTLAQGGAPHIIVTSAQNLLAKLPVPEIFSDTTLQLAAGMKLDIETLLVFLVKNGFTRAASAIDSGEFAARGEIVDIVTAANIGYRINFGWELVESIREFDTYSQISKATIDTLTLSSASESLLNSNTIINFKNNFLQIFGVNYINSPLYESIVSGQRFHGYEHLTPLLYEKMCHLTDFIDNCTIIYDSLCLQAILEHENTYADFYESRLLSNKSNPDSFYFAIPPKHLICSVDEAKESLELGNNILIESGTSNGFESIENISTTAKIEKKSEFEKLFEIIVENKNKIPIIFCSSRSAVERITQIAADYEYVAGKVTKLADAKKHIINLAIAPLRHSFSSKKYLLISEQTVLGNKFGSQSHKSSKKKLQNILTELDNISEGEMIVHKEHGIGMFERIQTIYVDEIAHDCLKIVYANSDILYLPVENIDQIKKYGNDGAVLDKLGGVNWQKRKAKLKNRIKDIAEKLIKVTAQRLLAKTNPTKFDADEYEKFANKFPYSETEDQLTSINDIKTDLESGKLMDRLICGDVGFGKTEVAMRAAFMISHDINDDQPQIAIISPTTILSKQHFKSFIERFKDHGIKIGQLSRLVKPAEARIVKAGVEKGDINIIIGTHALLASKVKFKNLKMIIIDEEQHFGVAQKEHLKNLKTDVHVLSLSATPIPRTLQMSMVGIKGLSLIATPPIDRLPVRTNVIPFDIVIIRDALMRERFRGGLSFYVVPRIKDIEWVEKQLAKYVPELRFKVAHGQMPALQIDNVMNEFCEGKFDILLSTTIIESGIDIPIANTMIIHRSDMLGLSQLYQLRGRVGRGKVRGFAYLTLPHYKKTTQHSLQKLDILQNIDSLGAGFTIASHDMDLRGFGNLIGDEQSGHIKEVGSELYQEMLDEAIEELKNNDHKDKLSEFTPSINLSLPVLIPSEYIEDSSLRLAIYRRAGMLKTNTEIESFKDEMVDRFGKLPGEFSNLLNMVKIKNSCQELKIESLDSGPNGFVIKFNQDFDVSDMVMNFIKKYPRHAKIKPDNKLVLMIVLKQQTLTKEAEKLLKSLSECAPTESN
jgi:transcription-repair coupling factor (superfamily II helicase)